MPGKEAYEQDRERNSREMMMKALREEHLDDFRLEFLDLHPYDQASFYTGLDEEIRKRVYLYLSPKEMAELFENIDIDEDEYKGLLKEMDPAYAAAMLGEMYADDAADVLNELDQDQVTAYLALMDRASANELKMLTSYDEYTAGSIMTTEYIAIEAEQDVQTAMKELKRMAPEAETIYYVYVTDSQKRLAGVVSLRDLIVAEDDTTVREIMSERIHSVFVSDDQEDVARTIRDYDFLAVPVVDAENRLLGIITVDDIMDVMEEEASDDYSKLAGVSDLDRIDTSPFMAAKKRLPWLIILLFLGLLTASLIGRFEETLSQKAILAVFIPLIGGMAGNTGTQALAVAVRGIATGDIVEESKWRLIAREAGTGLITGTVCGIAVTLIIMVWQRDLMLGLLVGISIFATLIVATLAGSFVPLLMHRFNIDPAVASGPFITTINDIISILIYFGMATVFMSYLL